MSFISRGFKGRRRDPEVESGRIPPGQHLVDDFPVLSAGPTPRTPLEEWTFSVRGGSEPMVWTWDEFRALPSERVTDDIHCVTKVVEARHGVGGRGRGNTPRRRRP